MSINNPYKTYNVQLTEKEIEWIILSIQSYMATFKFFPQFYGFPSPEYIETKNKELQSII
jgi:hypothetical protein